VTSQNKNLNGPLAWMVRHPVAANLLMFAFIVGGLLMCFQIKQEVFPEFTNDIVSVRVPYPGASPEEIEKGIILPVEEALSDVDGLDEVVSVASENFGVVRAEVLMGEDEEKISRDIQSAVDRITTFPDDAERPVVQLQMRHRRGMTIAIHGDTTHKSLRYYAENMRDFFLQNEKITSIDLSGTRPLEIAIEFDRDKLRAYNLTLPQVANVIRSSRMELPAGALKLQEGDLLVRVNERADHGKGYENVVIKTSKGESLLLKDIATIKDGFEEVESGFTWLGHPAILLDVHLTGNHGPIEISDEVKKLMEEYALRFPEGLGATIITDSSDSYRGRVELLIKNAWMGLLLVFVLLTCFLRMKLAFWVMMGIPTSFLGGLMLLPSFDVSLNMVTLFAFIISLGIVVDDAVVVGENIFEWRQRGVNAFEAAVLGIREVSVPVTFSILTNIVAFLPLAFVPGTMGKVFFMVPIVVILVFIVSWIEGLFILPAHLSHGNVKKELESKSWLDGFRKGLDHVVMNLYGPFLKRVLKYRYLTMAIAFAVLMLMIGFIQSGRLGMGLFPITESDKAVAELKFPFGTPAKVTQKALDQLRDSAHVVLEKLNKTDVILGIVTKVGSGGDESQGSIEVLFKSEEERKLGMVEYIDQWRETTPDILGTLSLIYKADSGGPSSGSALNLEFRHPNVPKLKEANDRVIAALKEYPMVKDIVDGFSPGKPQINFKLTPEGENAGFTANDVARQLRGAYFGSESLRQLRGRNEFKVRVRLDREQRESEYDLEEMILRSPQGIEMPLREIAVFDRGRAYTEIKRRNGARTITVEADVKPRSQAGLIKTELTTTILPDILKDYPGMTYSFEGRSKNMMESMRALGIGFIIAMFVIYALLAIPFNSYFQPLIIMVSIPFGIVGAVLGHIVMGYDLSIISMFGVVALAGVVVNDSLVLIDMANRKYKENNHALAAIHYAGVRRIRPILLTSLTTFGGLAPMIFETSRQAKFLIPMAISLGYGILFATIIALLVVPCLYMVLDDVKQFWKKL
jgi:multidrug efflux pump subunit AcrB